MLIIPSPKYRTRRSPLENAGPPAGPGALALVQASYDASLQTLMLKFNQPIDVSAYNGSRIRVNDGDINMILWKGTGDVELLDAVSVSIGLVELVATSAPGVFLNAFSHSGIVAVYDGAEWAGVSGLALPYP